MRVKLAQAGEGGGARPPPFTTFIITRKVAVYAPCSWVGRYTKPVSSLPIYVLCGAYSYEIRKVGMNIIGSERFEERRDEGMVKRSGWAKGGSEYFEMGRREDAWMK
jgi:hypothetical protein